MDRKLNDLILEVLAADGASDENTLDKTEEGEETWLSKCYDWYLDQGFEYVEVSTADEKADDSLSLIGDKKGVARVVEVLHCHRWPGSALKDPREAACAACAGESASSADREPEAGAEAEGDLAFDDLLSKLASARDAAATLSDEDRRKNAEKMLFSIMTHLGIED